MISPFQKIVLHIKVINKTGTTKIPENSHTILRKLFQNYYLQNFCKIGLNPKELELFSKQSQPAITCSKLTIETLEQGV